MHRLRTHWPLATLLLVALLWRLLLWAQAPHQPANDEVEYLQVARDLLAGRGWAFYTHWRWLRAPLYPLYLAGALGLAGLDPSASTATVLHRAALASLPLSLGVVSCVYWLTRKLTPASGDRPALIAAAAAALLQTNATFASLYMSETLFTFLFSWGLLALVAWRERRGWWRAIGAGALLGLACLTRSAALVFLPVVALWMAVVPTPPAQSRWPWLGPPLLLLLGTAAVIAPWTLRNCVAYERCILIETGGAYNLWAFYEPRESLATINQTLEAIPNPAERADEATRRGLAQLRADPLILLRKLPAEWTRLWVVKPIEDRFLLLSAYSDPPPLVFLTGLLLDDLLYLAILVLAPFGLAFARRNALGVLLGLWLLSFVAATLVTHAEGRYRHFLFSALIPLAAVTLDALQRKARLRPLLTLSAGMPLMLALLPCLLYYPWAWAGNGALRSIYRGLGDSLVALGRDEAAAQAYQQALAIAATPDGWLALGNLWRRIGATEAATAAYAQAHASEPTYVAASAIQGDWLRFLGKKEAARTAFRGRYVDEQRVTDWSYQGLTPGAVAVLEVGAGLDFGYVGGVYTAERVAGVTTRWTNGRGRVRLRAAGARQLVTLRVAAPWPTGEPVPLHLCAAGMCQAVNVGPTWRVVRLVTPTAAELELRSPTFAAPDRRDLGVQLAWVSVATLAP